MGHGICKLTGDEGKLVKSHLLPKAVTRPDIRGEPFIEHGQHGRPPARRWDSWRDKHLVTRKGEDILASLDDWAIKELRKHKLIWSGWGPIASLGQLHTDLGHEGWGIRSVEISDPKRLRLFYLSLLWRAAATSRWEFSEVEIPKTDLDRLKQILINADPGPL